MRMLAGVMFLFLGISIYGQVPVPTLIDWHARYDVDDLRFSADGNYLLSRGDDGSVIITDLRKRIPLHRVTGADEFMFEVHPSQPFFYTAAKVADSIRISKRNIPEGKEVESAVVPNLLGSGLSFQSPELIEADPAKQRYFVPYSAMGRKVVAVFSEQGRLLDSVTFNADLRISGIKAHDATIFMTASNGFYQSEGGRFRLVLTTEPNEYFANLQVHEQSVILLSESNIRWYDITNRKLQRTKSIKGFYAASFSDNTRNTMSFHHPFGIDAGGNVWITNTEMAQNTGELRQRPYAIARVGATIDYPLIDRETSTLMYQRAERVVSCHPKTGLVAFVESGNEVQVYHPNHQQLASFSQRQSAIDDVSFTGTPGKILLQTDELSAEGAGYLFNLANGRLEIIGTVDERMFYSERYGASFQKEFAKQNAVEPLYDAQLGMFRPADYMQKEKELYLRFWYKRPFGIPLPDGGQITLDEKGVLAAFNVAGKKQKSIELFGLKHESYAPHEDGKYVPPITRKAPFTTNHFVESYSYDSLSNRLVLYLGEYNTSHMLNVIHVIDLNEFRIVATYLDGSMRALPATMECIDGEGIFSIESRVYSVTFGDSVRNAKQFVPTRDGRYIVMMVDGYEAKDKLYLYDRKERTMHLLGAQYNVKGISTDPHSQLVFTWGDDNILMIWDPSKSALVGQLLIQGKKKFESLADVDAGYLLLGPDGYYMGENKYYQLIKLTQGNRSYSINEIDVVYNRPDKVLARFPYATETAIKPIREMAEKRAKKFGFQPANTDVSFATASTMPYFLNNNEFKFDVTMPAATSGFTGMRTYVNGSAVAGASPTLSKSSATVSVALVDAVNHIRIALVRPDGSETPGDHLYVNAPSLENGALYVIGMGVSKYSDSSQNLRYAAKDMTDLLNYLYTTDTYGQRFIHRFADSKVTVAVVDSIKAILSRAKPQDVVLCYFAGHGLLDKNNDYYLATHEMDFANPAANGIDIRKLNEAVAASPARKKMIMIDACHSGLVDDLVSATDSVMADEPGVVRRGLNLKGKRQQSSAVQYSFNHFNQGTGVDILAASAGNEYALELGDIRNGVFTYSVLNLLKSGDADLNHDKQVSLYEMQQSVSAMTKKLTKGAQRPVFRQNNLYQDIILLKTKDSYVSRFMEAAKYNNVEMLKLLMDKEGVPVDQKDVDGFTALCFAARDGSLDAVKFLLQRNADVAVRTKIGFSPLYLAAWNSHHAITYYLLANGASVTRDLYEWQRKNIRDKSSVQANDILDNFEERRKQQEVYLRLADALFNGNLSQADSILTATRANINAELIVEDLPLLCAPVVADNVAVVEWMLQRGANVNVASSTAGNTPLMFAAYKGSLPIVKLLLANGADKTVKNKAGRTAAFFARQSGNKELQDLLQ